MNWKAFTPLAIAVVLGLFAARLGLSLVNSGPKIVAVAADVPVLVANRDIEPGTTLTDTDLTIAKTTADSMATGALNSPGQAVGKVVKIGLVHGQTLTPNLFADDGAGYGVGATLPAGYRAVTIDVVETTGVAGFIMPKCKVDVLATILVDGKNITKTVLESVSVLAVGTRTNPTAPIDPAAPPSKTVTLLVKPKDAEKVELAATMSRIRLALRNGRDESQSQSEGVTLADLKGRRNSDATTTADPFAGTDDVTTTAAPATQPTGDVFPVDDHDTAATPATPLKPLKAVPLTRTWAVQVIKAGQVSAQTFEIPTQPQTPAVADDSDTDQSVVHVDVNAK